MAINWNQLRNWNGDQRNSFEELCCQLVAQEPVPTGSRFFRKGRPDAGLECYWRLNNGDEWGMQAKFFQTSPSSGQWAQINESVKRALEAHPRLTQYYICLPIDRSDARNDNQNSFQDKWNEWVVKWKSLASNKKMAVEFVYWGESEIGNRMASEQNRGRHWFWFNEERFSNEWFRHRVDEAVDNARNRFSPDLNVELPIRTVFDALGKTPRFFERFEALYSEALIKFKKLRGPVDPIDPGNHTYVGINEKAAGLFSLMSPWVHRSVDYFEPNASLPIPWDDIRNLANELDNVARIRISDINDLTRNREKEGQKTHESGYDTLAWELHSLREFRWSLEEILEYSVSDYSSVSNWPYLLLTGDAGQGKTHLLCQSAKDETYASRPRVMLHGEQFIHGEPWAQIISLLGMNCTREEFLGALEAAAQANNCRILIYIDALNEGPGNRLWTTFLPGMLTTLARYPWLGLCVSVRSNYQGHIIPDTLDEARITRLEHRGFIELPYEAISQFFAHYGIEPSIPIVDPEFTNPLFLKLFCTSLHNQGLTRAPLGLRGVTSIFQFYIDSIDAKLSRPEFLDYDLRIKRVATAVNALADAMAKINDDRLPLSEAKRIVDEVFPPVSGFQESLFSRMESEGVITVVPDYGTNHDDDLSECVRFTYQRFSDHMIVKRLLERYLDINDPEVSFAPRRTLGKLLKDERACRVNSGILGALTIQIPELIKRELPDIAPRLADLQPVREAFVQNFAWRDVDSFSSSTDNYINQQVLKYKGTSNDFWNSVITLSPVPSHPYNADRLHKVLKNLDMPDRDAWWSVFLHETWGFEGSVDRLVSWAWDKRDKSTFDDEVIRLVGTTLAWFLTSSNRFLRDGATKALVRIFEFRIKALINVLETMAEVDDPYVAERLYAVAYGCALRTGDLDGLNELAKTVYGHIFESGDPPPHILLRDYARGVIEVAARRNGPIEVDSDKTKPPYKSDWPGSPVMSEEELSAWGRHWDGMSDAQLAQVTLYGSVTGKLTGDFSNYVIGDLHEWTSNRLDQPHIPDHRESFDLFVASLTGRQKEAWDAYHEVKRGYFFTLVLGGEGDQEISSGNSDAGTFETDKLKAERSFIRTLRFKSKKHRIYEDVVKPFVDDRGAFSTENAIDGKEARRWIIQRIIDLGWTVERFGEFDRRINYRNGRESRKAERIGKKYQWLAYHELLARLSDNFELRYDSWSVQSTRYNGPWSLSRHIRDIDPSFLLRQTQNVPWEADEKSWWFPTVYELWDEPRNDVVWLQTTTNLPEFKDILEVVLPADGSPWLTLNGSYHWEQPAPPGEEHYEQKRRQIRYDVNSYLVKKADAEKLGEWASTQSWSGRSMPESHAAYEIFLGEFFSSPAFEDQDTPFHSRAGWTRGHDDAIPIPILVTDDQYGRDTGSFDCSIDSSIFIQLPCHYIVEGMNLEWKGIEGKWFDESGFLVATDPSVDSAGPKSLLMRKSSFIEFLDSKGLTLFWIVSGEKQSIGGSMSRGEYQGRLEINGFYFLDNGTITGTADSRFDSPSL